MFCSQCGIAVAEDDNFCKECGKPLQAAIKRGIGIEGNVNTEGDFVGRDSVKTLVLHLKEPGTYIIRLSGLILLVTIILLSYLAYQNPTIRTLAQRFFDRLQIPIENEETIPPTLVHLPTPVLTFTPAVTPMPTNTPIPTMLPTPTRISSSQLEPVLVSESQLSSSECSSPGLVDILKSAIEQCSEVNNNWACYGSRTVQAFPEEIRFHEPRDRQPLNLIEGFEINATGSVFITLQSIQELAPVRIVAFAQPQLSSTPLVDSTIAANEFSGGFQPTTTETAGRWGLAKLLAQASCSHLPLPLIINDDENAGHSIIINGVKAIVFQ